MKTCFVDSNILVSYLYPEHKFHSTGVKIIRSLIAQNGTLSFSPLVIDEVLYSIMKNSRVLHQLSHQVALQNASTGLKSILSLPNVCLINPPSDPKSQLKVLVFMKQFSLKPRDAYHLLTIKHHKIKYVATLDHDFDPVFTKTSLHQFSPQA